MDIDVAVPDGMVADPAKRRKRRSPEEIKARLLEAAREEFKARGFAGATTAAIAKGADVAEIQMFRYYPSKADLFREAIFAPLAEHFRTFVARHERELVDQAVMRETAHLYISELLAFLGEHAKMLVSLFMAETFEAARLGAQSPEHGLQSYLDECAATISQRASSVDDIDAGTIGRVAFGAVLGCVTYRDWLFPDQSADVAKSDWAKSDRAKSDRAKIDRAIAEFVLAGIGPHAGLGLGGN